MKAITLWQPWAFLILLAGHPDPDIAKLGKHFETRSWYRDYRGPLAIHSAKYVPPEVEELCLTVPFQKAFEVAGIKYNGDIPLSEILPCGVVLGVCSLVDYIKIIGRTSINGKIIAAQLLDGHEVTGNELAFGDYTPGRFAWKLDDAQPLPEPIPAKGNQGLWNWEPPKGIAV